MVQVQVVNRKVVGPTGKPLGKATIYGFFATITKRETGEKFQGGEFQVPGYILGNVTEAKIHRKTVIEQLSKSEQFIDSDVQVDFAPLELVGPLVTSQMQQQNQQTNIDQMLIGKLARKINDMQKATSLEINPLSNDEGKIMQIINDTRTEIAHEIADAWRQRAEAESLLVDAQGNKIAPTEQAPSPVEIDAEDAAAISELEAQDEAIAAENEAADNVIPFPANPESVNATPTDDEPIVA